MLNPKALRRNNTFLAGSVLRLLPPERDQLLQYLARSYLRGITTSDILEMASIRRRDAYLAYSPEMFEFHRATDAVPDDWPIHYLGIPQSDDLAESMPVPAFDSSLVLLIENKYANDGYFRWDDSFRQTWVRRLVRELQLAGLQLLVKTHPGDRTDVSAPYVAAGDAKLVSRRQLPELLHWVRFVIGTVSTMPLPLAAMRHTAVITLEIHPEAGHYPSRDIVEAGVAFPVFDWTSFADAIRNSADISARQAPDKAASISRFPHRLDGRAGERLRQRVLLPFENRSGCRGF